MTRTAADLIASALTRAGVTALPNLSGNHVMSLFTALERSGIRLVHTRHEAAAVHIADAMARLADRPCPALVTAGPGFANTPGALYTALQAQSPVVILAGAIEEELLGRPAFQAMDQVGLSRDLGIPARLVRASTALADLGWAFRDADRGVPSPRALHLCADVGGRAIPAPNRAIAMRARRRAADAASIRTACDALRGARRPLLIGGPVLARGDGRALQRRCEETGIPAVALESPRGLGDPAMGGLREVLREADAVVLVGKPLDFAIGYGQPPAVAADARLVRLAEGRSGPGSLAPSAHPTAALAALLAACGDGRRADGGWLARTRDLRDWRPAVPGALSAGAIHPGRVGLIVERALGASDILVADGGEFSQWVQAFVRHPDRVLNGPAGAIGGALPFAIGARMARPDARIIAISGDGALGFHLAEFETAAREDLPFVLIVGNDRLWNAESVIQSRLGGPPLRTLDLSAARYDQAAIALGGYGERVETEQDLMPAIERALASRKPALIDVAIQPVPAPSYAPIG